MSHTASRRAVYTIGPSWRLSILGPVRARYYERTHDHSADDDSEDDEPELRREPPASTA